MEGHVPETMIKWITKKTSEFKLDYFNAMRYILNGSTRKQNTLLETLTLLSKIIQSRPRINDILQTNIPNVFSWMKIYDICS